MARTFGRNATEKNGTKPDAVRAHAAKGVSRTKDALLNGAAAGRVGGGEIVESEDVSPGASFGLVSRTAEETAIGGGGIGLDTARATEGIGMAQRKASG